MIKDLMQHNDFKKAFLISFLSYMFIGIGVLTIILVAEPVFGEEVKYRFNNLLGRNFVLPRVVTSAGENPQLTPGPKPSTSLGNVSSGGSEIIVPKSTDFGIVIEKINANSNVIANVDPGSESEYKKALLEGVAHAKGTVFPGQKGNIYLFSHSVGASWATIRYNAVFYLLNKLERGDRIIMFFEGRRYDYIVYDKAIAKPTEVEYLTNTYDQSILTLQTCDPPGTLVNRLIIRAKLAVES